MPSCAILYNVIMQNNLLCFKIVYNKKHIQTFERILTFISLREASREELYIAFVALPLMIFRFFASLYEMNVIFNPKYEYTLFTDFDNTQ